MKFEEKVNEILRERVRIKNPTISDKPQLFEILGDGVSWIVTQADRDIAKKIFMKKFGIFAAVKLKNPTAKNYEDVKSIEEIEDEIR